MANRNRYLEIPVLGISYEDFARIKWRQFIRVFSLAVGLIALVLLILTLRGQGPAFQWTAGLVAVLAVAALLGIYRASIRRAYRASGLGETQLVYRFDRDGWTVIQGTRQVRVLWSNTHRVQRTPGALLLYPNRKSVNLVPLAKVGEDRLRQILAWCQGKKA